MVVCVLCVCVRCGWVVGVMWCRVGGGVECVRGWVVFVGVGDVGDLRGGVVSGGGGGGAGGRAC